jgi:hypothetical protein
MRLTLRTLLAYLDDTLDPGEIKPIGQKVAESDAAQELIARIKQITRRRRITTPPLTGPGAKFDPNTVSEYLDNQLPTDQVAELEKICLESDVHLAEIAACHQILTLVLGEPALVPPTAKERMYQLVLGREAIPYRKAPGPVTTQPGSHHELEPDESPLLGLAFFRRPGWARWVLPIAGVLLVAALGVAIWRALPDDKPQQVAVNDPNKRRSDKDKGTIAADKDKDKDQDRDKAEEARLEKEKAEREKKEREDKEKEERVRKEREEEEARQAELAKARRGRKAPPPRTERVLIGSILEPERGKSVLVSRPRLADDGDFKRLMPGAAAYSNETLVSLPGYTTQIETKSGDVVLTMRGNLPEFSVNPLMDFLLEVEAVLHAPTAGIDLELTLERGRIYLANNRKDNKEVAVRLRFLDNVWDVTLKDGAEVGVDLIKKYAPGIDYLRDEPWTDVALFVLQGKADVKVNSHPKPVNLEMPGPALLQWDSTTDQPPTPTPIREAPLIWSNKPPAVVLVRYLDKLKEAYQKTKLEDPNFQRIKFEKEYYEAQLTRTKAVLLDLDEMSNLLTDKRPPVLVLQEERQNSRPERRHAAIFALGALGAVVDLLAVLNLDEDPEHAPERDEAVFALRRYACRGAAAGRALYHDEGKMKSGVLVEKLGEKDGEKVFTLLHDFNPKDLTEGTFRLLAFYLRSDRLAVRTLAYWHLARLSVGASVPAAAMMYNPADPSRQRREDAAAVWQQLVEDKKLPPRQP